jgi:hypothetical protein
MRRLGTDLEEKHELRGGMTRDDDVADPALARSGHRPILPAGLASPSLARRT